MQLTAQVKLQATPAQADALRRTMERTNAACNYMSGCAWETGRFHQYSLHHLCYREVRDRFGLAAQVAVRAIAKVADAYKLDRDVERNFRPMGSIAYDNRILAFGESAVSIWSLDGRLAIPFACGDGQRLLLASPKAESDLVSRRGNWYLLVTCTVPDAEPVAGQAMGIDLGIRNTAATSHGTLHSGLDRRRFKEKRHKVRASLQSRNNRSARKALRRQSGRERRRITWENHNLSKAIVAEAEGTQSGAIRMERLAGIRRRCKVFNKHTNRMMSGWSFGQLQLFLKYKAERRGIKVELVDPAYTSQVCAQCGVLGVRRGDVFSCTTCGKSHADIQASVNIAKGGVARPDRGKPSRIAARC